MLWTHPISSCSHLHVPLSYANLYVSTVSFLLAFKHIQALLPPPAHTSFTYYFQPLFFFIIKMHQSMTCTCSFHPLNSYSVFNHIYWTLTTISLLKKALKYSWTLFSWKIQCPFISLHLTWLFSWIQNFKILSSLDFIHSWFSSNFCSASSSVLWIYLPECCNARPSSFYRILPRHFDLLPWFPSNQLFPENTKSIHPA